MHSLPAPTSHALALDDSVISSSLPVSVPIHERLFKTTLESKRLNEEIAKAPTCNTARAKKRTSFLSDVKGSSSVTGNRRDKGQSGSVHSPNFDPEYSSAPSSNRNSSSFSISAADIESSVDSVRSTKAANTLAETPLSDLFAKLQENPDAQDVQVTDIDSEAEPKIKREISEQKLESNFENLSKELDSYWSNRQH